MPELFNDIFEFFSAVFEGILFPFMTEREFKFFYFILPFLFGIIATLIVEVFRLIITQVKK